MTQVIAFIDALKQCNENEAKRLYNLDNKIVNNAFGMVMSINSVFETICRQGNESLAKWLYEIQPKSHPIDIRGYNNSIFFSACRHGNTSLARWIYDLCQKSGNPVDISTEFSHACIQGNIRAAKWLYNLAVEHGLYLDINYYTFYNTCSSKHENIFLWLYDLLELPRIDNIFHVACQKKCFRIALRLYKDGSDIKQANKWFRKNLEKHRRKICEKVEDVLEKEQGLKNVDRNVFKIITDYAVDFREY